MKAAWVAFGITLLFIFYVGLSLYLKRYAKSLEDYWVMGRTAKWWMFAGTICAAYVSMWTFMAGVGIAWGWGPMAPMLFYTSSLTFGWIIATILIGLRLRKLECNTISEFFEKRFGGGDGKLLTGLSIAIAGSVFFYLLLQIQGGGILLSTACSIPLPIAVAIMAAIVIITLDLAGMWSVVITDTFSCIIFIIIAILVLPATIHAVGGLDAGIQAMNQNGLWSATGKSKLDMGYFVGYALSWLAIVGGSPHLINRTLIIDEPKSVFKGTFVAYILTIILTVVLFLSGSLLIAVIKPGSMPLDNISPFAATNIWPLPLGMAIIIGAMGAAFTTANAQALTISQSVVDFYRFVIKKDATSDKQLKNITRIVSLVTLIVVGLVAMQRVWILAIASSLAGIICSLGVFPVILLSLYWGRITKKAVTVMLWASVPIGVFMIVTNYFYKWFAPFPTLYSFPIGFGGLILLSYLTKTTPEEVEGFKLTKEKAFGVIQVQATSGDYALIGSGFVVICIVYFIILKLIGIFG